MKYPTPAELEDRYFATKMWKDRWLARYQQVYFYVLPDRDAFNIKFNYNDPGKPLTEQMWDPTAMLAAYQRTNDLHGLILPQDRVWGKVTMDEHQFDEQTISSMSPILDNMNSTAFYYINKSNLARAVSASLLDINLGISALWVESHSDQDPLVFYSLPGVAVYPEYTNEDILNTGWFQAKMTHRQILSAFPKYRGPSLVGMKSEPDEMTTVLYGQIKMSPDRYYFYAVLDDEKDYLLWEDERSYPRLVMARDRVRPGEAEGRGIALDMIPMIKDLNQTVMYSIKNLALTAQPPLFVDDDAYFNPNSVYQWAGAIFKKRPGDHLPLRALEMPHSPEVEAKIMRLQEQIIKGFQVDPLGEINAPVKTATEIATRENRAQRTSATDISRLINELPRQIYDIVIKILSERRLLDKDRKYRISSEVRHKLRFDYQSPLFDIQNKEEIYNFTANMQVLEQFLGQGAASATINPEKAIPWLAKKFNIKPDLIKNEQQIQQMMTQMAQMAAVQQQQQMLGQLGAGQPQQVPGPQEIQF